MNNETTITLDRISSGPISGGSAGLNPCPILVVEDPVVQKFLRTVLQRRGYRTVEATPSHALELVERGAESVGMVITNTPEVFLPFAEKVSLLYIAACPDLTLISPFRNCRALRKPFHPTELVEAVRELVRSL